MNAAISMHALRAYVSWTQPRPQGLLLGCFFGKNSPGEGPGNEVELSTLEEGKFELRVVVSGGNKPVKLTMLASKFICAAQNIYVHEL